MKILALNGSHRGEIGFTAFLINKIFEGARRAGAECQCLTLSKLRIYRCNACDICHTKESYQKCIYDSRDDVRMIFRKIADADIVIFATPVYMLGMSGLLKSFLDRLNSNTDSNKLELTESGLIYNQINRKICSKPFVTLITCDNLEDEMPKNIIHYFKTYSHFMDAAQVGTLVRNMSKIIGNKDNPHREKLMPKVEEIYKNFENAGYELATKGRITNATQRRANKSLIELPFFPILKHFKPFKKQIIYNASKLLLREKS